MARARGWIARAVAASLVCGGLTVVAPAIGGTADTAEAVPPNEQQLPVEDLPVAGQSRTAAPWRSAESPGQTAFLSDEMSTEPFRLIGVTWDGHSPDQTAIAARYRADGNWSEWVELDQDHGHGPDPSSGEASSARGGTDPLLVPPSDAVQLRIQSRDGSLPRGARLHLVEPGQSPNDTSVARRAPGSAQASTAQPTILSRAEWGADESMRGCCVEYGSIGAAFVHHTVNANDYQPEDVPAMIRAIYAYHVNGRGWRDIGYNFIIDRFGRTWEGRYGGTSKPVVGAHTLGHNGIAFGASALGTHTDAEPSDATLDAFARLMAWKLSLHGVDPKSRVIQNGETIDAISGHQDVYATLCPGGLLYRQLPTIRTATAELMNSSDATQSLTYVKAPYSKEIYAIAPDGTPTWLTYADWTAAGKPAPTSVPEIPGTSYVKTSWSSAVYAVQPSGNAYWITYSQWQAAGSPRSTTVAEVPGTAYVKTPDSPAIYAVTPDGAVHQLTYQQYLAAGKPAYTIVDAVLGRLVKVSWSPNVYEMRSDGTGRWISAGEYQAAGSPPISLVSEVPTLNEVIPRPADGVIDLTGRGYGHGTGMSQWGAYQAAVEGEDWRTILDSYYPGTGRVQESSGDLRVRITADTGYDFIVRPETGLAVTWTDQSSATRSVTLPASVDGCSARWWRVRSVDSDLALEALCSQSWKVWQATSAVNGDRPVTFRAPDGTIDTAVRTSSGFIRKGYRGSFEASRSGSSVIVTNLISVENYLRSVVPSEAPPSWPAEALKAQSVAARTYALRERFDRSRQSFDVYDSTRSQVYPGLVLYDGNWNTVRTYEDSRSTAAVAATAGVHLESGGIPAFTQFSSSNGGWTSQGSQPYLRITRDDWDRRATSNPYRSWSDTVSVSSLESRHPSIGSLQRIRVTERDGGGTWGGRITRLVLEGSKGTVTLRGDSSIRSALGTRSSYLTLL